MRTTTLRLGLTRVMLLTGMSATRGGYMLMRGAWEMDPAWPAHTPFET